MNIVTGTGKMSWAPKRLTADAWGNLASAPAETFPSPLGDVIAGTFNYGPLGTCRGATLQLSSFPPNWAYEAFPRYMRIYLESEFGVGKVFNGIVHSPRATPGSGTTVQLMGIHEAYAGDVSGATPLLFPSLLVGAARLYGVALPTPSPIETREELFNRVLEPYPNSEWGVGPDDYAVIGRPESASGASYYKDYDANQLALDFRNLGFAVSDYVTSWTFDPGQDWEKYSGTRSPIPYYLPRRTATASASPSTIETNDTLTVTRKPDPNGDYPFQSFVNDLFADNVARTYDDPGAVLTPGGNPVTRIGSYNFTVPPTVQKNRRNKRLTVTISFTVTNVYPTPNRSPDGQGAILKLDLMRGAGPYNYQNLGRTILRLLPERNGQKMNVVFEVPGEHIADGGTFSILSSLQVHTTGYSINLTVHPIVVSVRAEVPNLAGLVLPPGYSAPYETGPTYEFSLRGWHVPPIQVVGLPNGVTQFVAGAEVTWNSGEARTKLLTAALPYPGQKRRG